MVFSRGWLTGLRKLNKLKSKRGDVSPLFIKAGSALTANHTASVFCARCRGSDRVPERLWFGYGGCISIRFSAAELSRLEEHTSELQLRGPLVLRLLVAKNK